MDDAEAGTFVQQMNPCKLREGAWSGICRVRGIASAGSKVNNLRSAQISDRLTPPPARPFHEVCESALSITGRPGSLLVMLSSVYSAKGALIQFNLAPPYV